jgi:hypothetical protein
MSRSKRIEEARKAYQKRDKEAAAVAHTTASIYANWHSLSRPAVSFSVSLALSGLAPIGLGATKVLVTGRNALKSGLEMLLVGGLAAGVAYLVGTLLKGIGG